ncbi:DNA repair protein RadA [Marivirga sp.]|uniref:DNA repair protein RadA n=1 Tax=Marivirga sp. TaxID=2018662 RepID=UPI002D7E9F12|nr:DNA repair protein RadA [Marivirga sp.]HET8859807.1 DNA repair protein RadA [Marivirga sp.]
MAKVKSAYFCQECGHESPKWVGKCPSCGQWNTFVEEVVAKEKSSSGYQSTNKRANKPIAIQEVESTNEARIKVADRELSRVLGGGIVPGSLVLIGGEPGIGKSTLMLQIALQLSNLKVLYVSGEESAQQIKMRADRMEHDSKNCFILTETHTADIFREVEALGPDLLVIDSIQTLHSPKIESAAGSVGQVKECTAELMRFAKENKIPVFLIGHITKDGAIAGPKVLEHMVDAVLQFEGDRHLTYRILRTTKNRFGSTNELGIYEMMQNGLRQVSNPSEILISQKDKDSSGTAIGATLEGNRPLLIEIQALVSAATYGTPQRSATGYDSKRLNMLLAVLEKRGGFRLGVQDVFLNIAGGVRVEDPAIDLAVCIAIISSLEEIPLSSKTCVAAEVGLSGEIRAVNRIENRIAEAEKLGFTEILVSKFSMKGVDISRYNIEIKTFSQLGEVVSYLFG